MWLAFGAVVAASLVIDLLVHRGGRGTSRGAAIAWSAAWIAVALAFAGWIAIVLGRSAAEDYLGAYLMEKTLSVDNLFVFLLVFGRLGIPPIEQHRVLFWGILGALAARGVFIAAGTAVLARWHEVVYVLGAVLLVTGWRTLRAHGTGGGEDSRLLRWLRRHLPLTSTLHGHHFFVREDGRRRATPLLLALLAIELTDVMFAVDSVPAVFAITRDPFLVYSSNVFAILGLRALYLVLADMLERLRYMHYGLGAILLLAGVKMLVADVVHVPHYAALAAILVIIAVTVIASLRATRRDAAGAAGG
jgi:tellurite resistance protein TerC